MVLSIFAQPAGMTSLYLNPDLFVPSQIKKVLLMQLGLVAIVSAFFLTFGGYLMALSSLVGGLIALLPACFYGWRVGLTLSFPAKQAFQGHVVGQAGKYVFTIILFSIAFTLFTSINILALFSSYIAALLVYWLALIIFTDKV